MFCRVCFLLYPLVSNSSSNSFLANTFVLGRHYLRGFNDICIYCRLDLVILLSMSFIFVITRDCALWIWLYRQRYVISDKRNLFLLQFFSLVGWILWYFLHYWINVWIPVVSAPKTQISLNYLLLWWL
jgi:hypothetical protein